MFPIYIKRAYQSPNAEDGYRVLVDRLWPRGVPKDALKIDEWTKDIAPSDKLRKWFNHEPAKWNEFKTRYFQELGNYSEHIERLMKIAMKTRLTLIFAAKDETYNNANAIKEYLESKISRRTTVKLTK